VDSGHVFRVPWIVSADRGERCKRRRGGKGEEQEGKDQDSAWRVGPDPVISVSWSRIEGKGEEKNNSWEKRILERKRKTTQIRHRLQLKLRSAKSRPFGEGGKEGEGGGIGKKKKKTTKKKVRDCRCDRSDAALAEASALASRNSRRGKETLKKERGKRGGERMKRRGIERGFDLSLGIPSSGLYFLVRANGERRGKKKKGGGNRGSGERRKEKGVVLRMTQRKATKRRR